MSQRTDTGSHWRSARSWGENMDFTWNGTHGSPSSFVLDVNKFQNVEEAKMIELTYLRIYIVTSPRSLTCKTKRELSWNRAYVWVSDLSLSRSSRANVRTNASNPKKSTRSLANLEEKNGKNSIGCNDKWNDKWNEKVFVNDKLIMTASTQITPTS